MFFTGKCGKDQKNDLVLEDIDAHVILKRVTEYPGIKTECPQK